MNIFNPKTWGATQKKTQLVSERKSTTIPLASGSFLEQVFSGANITASQAAAFYRTTSPVATAVDMTSSAIEQINPFLEMPDGKLTRDHELIRFLHKPNGFHLWHDFIGKISRDYLLSHDVLLASIGNTKRKPISVWPSSMQDVSVMQNSLDQYPQTYQILTGPVRGTFERDESERNNYRFIDGALKEVYRIKGYTSRSAQIFPDSPLQAAANEAKQLIKGKYHNLKLLDNGGRLSLMIAFNDDDVITDDEHQERIQRINEQYSGAENAGKIGVISNADITMKELGVNNKDMDYGNLETLATNAIYLRYHIPLPLVTTKASTFNNVATGVGIFYDTGVLPLADILFAGLTQFFMPRFGLDPLKYKLTYNPESIGPLKRRKIEEIELRKKINVETTNELRSDMPGREPLKGGDILYQNSKLVPIGTDLKTDDNNDT